MEEPTSRHLLVRMRIFLHTATLFLGLTAAMFAVVFLHLSMGSKVVDIILMEQQQHQHPANTNFRANRVHPLVKQQQQQQQHHKPRLRASKDLKADAVKKNARVDATSGTDKIEAAFDQTVIVSTHSALKREYVSSMGKTRNIKTNAENNLAYDNVKADTAPTFGDYLFHWILEYLLLLFNRIGDVEAF